MDPKRTLRRRGESVTVVRYADSGSTDEYGDPVLNETTTSANAIVEKPRQKPHIEERATGEVTTSDVIIYLSDDVTVDDATDAIRPSTIERAQDGKRYRVELVYDEGNGLQQCECVRKDDV